MSVYKLAYVYLLISKSTICVVLAAISVIDKGILPLEKNSIGIQFYVDIENEDRKNYCRTQSKTQRCCLTRDKESDCETMTVHGTRNVTLKPQDRQTLTFIYPTLILYDQVGHCEFVVNYSCNKRLRRSRIEANIPFDTRLRTKKETSYMNTYKDERNINDCDSLDEDPLNDCKPVNCDFKYAGEKPFYDYDSNKCVRAPICTCDLDKDLPDIVYIPQCNVCRDLDNPLTVADIYAISTGLGVVNKPIEAAENLVVQVTSNCSTISQNLILLKDLMCGKLCPFINADVSSYKHCFTSALLSILGCIFILCALIFSFVCCIHTTVWLYIKWSDGDLRDCFKNFKGKFLKTPPKPKPSRVKKDITNALLKEVIVRDLPLDMRESIVDICDRIEKEVKCKKRYRRNDLGSQVELKSDYATSTEFEYSSDSPDNEEKSRLMK